MSLITRLVIGKVTRMCEFVDVYDQDGNFKGYTKERNSLSVNEYLLSVHIYLYNNAHELILQKRALSKKEMPGVWCVTGGVVATKETSLHAAKREVNEELGIIINDDQMRYLGRCFNNNYLVDIFSARCDVPLNLYILKEDEVMDVKLMALEEALPYINSLSYNETSYLNIINSKLRACIDETVNK